jgi:hypothetical protein
MSDNIVINITPASPNRVDVTTDTTSNNVNVVASSSPVVSVNGKFGSVVITKDDIGLDQVENINVSTNFVHLSGDVMTGGLSADGTITAYNLATNNQIQFLANDTVKVYQYYNDSTNSLDTVFP